MQAAALPALLGGAAADGTPPQDENAVARSNGSEQKRRTIQEIRSSRNSIPFDPQMPMGPWSPGKTGLDEAWTEFDAWAKNKRTGGGAFGLRKGSSRSATAKKGAQQLYECSRAGKYTPAFSHVGESKQRQCGSEKCECPWGVWLEESDEGWVTSQMKGGGGDRRGSHNHELVKSLEAANAEAALREIPPALEVIGDAMHIGGASTAKINQTLKANAKAIGIEVTWNYSDVAKKWAATAGERMLDTSGMLDNLREREQTRGLEFRTMENADLSLAAVFIEVAGARDLWLQSNSRVGVLDTKSCTNRLGMHLAMLVTTDANGVTRILAICLLDSQFHDRFEFIFRSFESVFGSRPAVLFTDGDPAMALAMNNAWQDVVHLLCVYHLWKNFHKHIKPLFIGTGGNEFWRKTAKLWWCLCKDSDTRAQSTFDVKWAELAAFISNNATAGTDKVQGQAAWLESMRARQKQWAGCWTYRWLTYGLHSTQRIEAIHSGVQTYSRKSAMVKDLIKDVESHADSIASRSETAAIRAALKNSFRSTTAPLCVREQEGAITPFAFGILRAQAAEAEQYVAVPVVPTPVRDVRTVYCVRRSSGAGTAAPAAAPPPVVAPAPPAATNDANDDGVPDDVRDADLGLVSRLFDHSEPDRITTCTTCTCQMFEVWGIICRHSLKCASVCDNGHRFAPAEVVAPFWMRETSNVRAGAGATDAPPPPTPAAASDSTPAGRTQAMQAEFSLLASLAGLRVELTTHVIGVVRQLTNQVRSVLLPAPSSALPLLPTHGGGASANATGATAAGAPLVIANCAYQSGAAGRHGGRFLPADPTAPTSRKRAAPR